MYYFYKRSGLVWLLVLLLSGIASIGQAQTLLWGNRAGGTGTDYTTSVAVDAAGNSYVTGVFSGTVDFDPSPSGTASLTSLGANDAFIAKYDPAGNYLWAKALAGSGTGEISNIGYNIAVDGSGNCYITGTFSGTVDFNPSPSDVYSLTGAEGGLTMVLAKYDTEGNFVRATGTAGAAGVSLALDGPDIYVTGGFRGTVSFGPSQTATLEAGTLTDFFVARYNASGELIWIRSIDAASSIDGSIYGTDIGVDAGGNVYIKGRFSGIIDLDPTTATNEINSTNGVVFLTKYSSAGTYQWGFQLPGDGSTSFDIYGLKVDPTGNSYVTGAFRGTNDFDPSTEDASLSSAGSGSNVYIAKYSAAGSYQWAIPLSTTQIALATDIEVDAAGNCYAVGVFAGEMDFDPSAGVSSLSAPSSGATYVAKYNRDGGYIQANKLDVAAEARYRLALDSQTNLYLTGAFSNSFNPALTGAAAALTPAGGLDFFVLKYAYCPSIAAQPAASSVVCAGGSATVTVGVSGTVSGYQWFHNGTAVSGQTTATLSLTNIQAADAGSYVAVITNSCSSLTSTSFSLVVGSGIVHVTESGSGLQNGSSWANSLPGSSLQFAIDQAAACTGGQVWVAMGTYKPTSTTARDISFSMRNNVAIYGGFLGSETALSGRPAVNPVTGQPGSSTLSGEIGDPNSLTDNSYHVIHHPESLSLNNSAVLDGFVITGGYADTYPAQFGGGGVNNQTGNSPVIQQCLFLKNYAFSGGGVYNTGSSPVLTNCVFQSNTAVSGGGMTNEEVRTAVLTNCIFLNNQAGTGGAGGGIWNFRSRVVITNNTFRFNSGNLGGGLSNQSNSEVIVTGSRFFGNTAFTAGGGIRDSGSSVTITGCTLESNTAGSGGGGIDHADTDLTVTNCRFLANHSGNIGGGMRIFTPNIILRIINSSFERNSAGNRGGAINTDGGGSTTLTNCSFLSNSVNSAGTNGAIINWSATLINCVEYDNETGKAFIAGVNAQYSLFAPSSYTTVAITGTNNLTATVSPFASTTGAQLAACSPAINAGDPTTSSTLVGPTDLAGNNRFFNGGGIDMGAYEFQGEGQPISYSVLGSGTATCAASPTITVSGSETGVSYQLRRDDVNIGGVVPGTGSALSFGPQSLSGVYTVLATRNSNSCTAVMGTSATVVSTSAVISASLVASGAISCSATSVTLTATPAALTYVFGSGATQIGTTSQATVNTAGTYSVTVSDAAGCSAVAQVTVTGSSTAPAGATLTAGSGGTLTCGQSTLTLSASATGSGLSYSFSGPGVAAQSGSSATVSAAGSYSVLITGSNGCTATATTTVYSNTAAPDLSLSPAAVTLTCANPSAVLSVTGTGSVLWSTGAVSNTISVATAGTYSVTLTGANSCTSVRSATVVSGTVAASVSITPTSGTISCTSQTVSLSAIGTGSVLWSTGASTSVISATAAGVYSVTLTNGSGCTATASITISGTLLGAATVTTDGSLGCGQTSAQINVQATGATSFTLLGPNGYTQTNSSGVFSVTAGGSYTGLAGQSGCVVSSTVVVIEGGAQPGISSVQASGALGSGACRVSVQGAGYGDRYVLTGPSGYVFSVVFRTVGEHAVVFPDVVKPGTYTLTVYSGNCVVTQTVAVTGTACP